MIKLKTSRNLKKVLDKHRRFAQNVGNLKKNGLIKVFLQRNRDNYRVLAQGIVLDQVYRAYQPKKYQRTFNLISSIVVDSLNSNSFAIQIPLTSNLKMDKPNDNHGYYPALVIAGITSTHPVPGYPKRDFYYSARGWLKTFGRRFANDYYKHIIQRLYK